jgi:hypothetical protein
MIPVSSKLVRYQMESGGDFLIRYKIINVFHHKYSQECVSNFNNIKNYTIFKTQILHRVSVILQKLIVMNITDKLPQ